VAACKKGLWVEGVGMCGISGYTHKDRVVDEGVIRRAAESLLHRGPDQQGVYESRDVSLGVVRLKVIDPDGGDQPMVSEDGNTVIVFNGEVYNHKSIRDELEKLGHRFRSRCDTEVILHAFIEWDTGCFQRLRGMFAIAVLSDSGRRLVLARDRMGIKPLYYHQRGQNLYFGSELKAILEHDEVDRTLDMIALQEYLSFNYVPSDRTLLAGMRKLAPGHWLEWNSGEVRVSRWWELSVTRRRGMSLESAKEELDGLIRQSVREQLVSDVPLGIWASGGLDSSTILHYAAEESAQRLKTFSISFDSRCCDETEYFREIAEAYGTDHHEFCLTSDVDLRDAIEDFAWYSDEPCGDAGAVPVWFLSRMSRRHVTVALSGDGADELFGGYITYQADNWARYLRAVPAGIRRLALNSLQRWWPASDEKISTEYKLKRWIEGSFLPSDEAHFFWNGAFSSAQKELLLPGEACTRFAATLDDIPASMVRGLNRYMLLDQKYYLVSNILPKLDRMSMAHALEVRPPYLDHRIVEFAASLPEKYKIRGFTLKCLLKELMSGKLPDRIIRRKKMGLDIPTHRWFRGPLVPLLQETLSPTALESIGVFDSAYVQRLIRDHLERQINAGYHLWGMLTLVTWMKRWGVQAPMSPAMAYSEALAVN
jgi:asparagine synthase (glutamine-hydrolysing)